ncbi:MAG: antibiotic biosynthesis monooxygenase [Phycisphaerae bacterium]|nr:antibiotic biosynthesis monooxygenase [Phycisphaerae bacterium]
MIHVIATIRIAPGKRDEYLEIFAQLVPKVRAEQGCLAYGPAVDVDSGISVQMPLRDNVVTAVEQWSDLDALKAHISAPHMEEYKENVKDIVVGLDLQILQPV